MAAGGEPSVPASGSDEFHPFTCSPCSRKDLDVGAEVYCKQCEEYFCGKCLDDHNKFAKMAAHTFLDQAQMEAKGPQRVQPLLTVSCEQHPGQVYSKHCGKHDQVCCGECVEQHHKSCGISYITDVAKSFIRSHDPNKFQTTMKEIQKNLENAMKKQQADIERLTTEKDAELQKIQNAIKKMMSVHWSMYNLIDNIQLSI